MNDKPTRRSFFGRAGAALAMPFAATVAFGGEHHGKTFVAGRSDLLQDVNAIRVLLHDYARRVNVGAQAAPTQHVRSMTLAADAAIQIAANGTATARVPCTVETATPLDGHDTVVEMARLQGDGFIKRSERRTLAATAIKHHGIWTLEQTELTA